MLIGLHLRTHGDLLGVVDRAEAARARAVQVFTQSPRSWARGPVDHGRYRAYAERVAAGSGSRGGVGVDVTLCHSTYLINLAAPDDTVRAASEACLVANLAAAVSMGAIGVVVHPGSHRGSGWEAGARRVADGLRRALDRVPGSAVLLENTAGSGDTMGRTLDELADLLGRSGDDDRLRVCLDSQHLFAAGVAYATPADMDLVVAAVDATVGLDRLAALHVNDSQVAFGSQRDRHASLGLGTIGLPALRCFLGHPALDGLPAVIETPGREGGDPGRGDVEMARRLRAAGRRRYTGAVTRAAGASARAGGASARAGGASARAGPRPRG